MTTDQNTTTEDSNPDVRGDIDLRTVEGIIALVDRVIDAYKVAADVTAGDQGVGRDALFMLNGMECVRSELVGQREALRNHVDQLNHVYSLLNKAQRDGAFPAMELEVQLLRGQLDRSVPIERLENALRTADHYADDSKRHRKLLKVTAHAFRATTKELDGTRVELSLAKEELGRCQELVAAMHRAAVGEVKGPEHGVVEDVLDVRARMLGYAEKNEQLLRELDVAHRNRDDALKRCRGWENASAANAEGRDHAVNERDLMRQNLDSVSGELERVSHELDLKTQELAAANDERDRLTRRIAANKGDVTTLSMTLEAERDMTAGLKVELKKRESLVGAVHGLLATLDDVQCPHGLAIRQTVAALTGYQGDAPARVIVDDDAAPTFAAIMSRFGDLSTRLQRLEAMLSLVPVPSSVPSAVDDFDGITPVPSGNDGPRLRR